MLVTIITNGPVKSGVFQVESPTVKDCLISWAGKVEVEGMTDEGRTRLRGDMADFDPKDHQSLPHVWKVETDLGIAAEPRATVYVVETVRG